MKKLYVYREEMVRGKDRHYLMIDDLNLLWLPVSAHKDAAECKKHAKAFTEIEATFAIQLAKLSNPHALLNYGVEEAK